MDFYVTIGDIRDTIHTYWKKHQTSPKISGNSAYFV